MFRDLAKFICDIIMGHMKHWKYFKMYFGVMSQAFLTRKRYVMVFPDTSPRGLQLVTISAPGAPPVYDIHPEYKPQNKIPAGVFAYNFSIDDGYADEDIYRDFSVEEAFNIEQEQTYMPLPISPYVDAYAYIFGDSFDQIFVFEPIAVLPMAVLDATAFDLEEQVIDASKALRGDKSLLGAFGFYSRGFYNKWFITPDYVGAQSVIFIGWDSGITGFKIDSRRLDGVLDAARPSYQDIQNPEMKAAIMFIEYSQLRDRFVLGDLGGAVEIFWHLGPPMWMYTIYDMYIGLVAYVSVEYEDTIYFLNDTPIYVGDLEFKVLNYTTKIIRRGQDAYIYGFDSTDGRYKLYKGKWGMEKLYDFDRGKYYTGPEILLAKKDKDLYLLQAISREFETYPMIRYKNVIVKEDVFPTKVIGSNVVVMLKRDGNIEAAPEFQLVGYGWLREDKKIMTDGGISVVDRYPVGILGMYIVPGYVEELVGAYQSLFIKQNDVQMDKYLFVDFGGYVVQLLDYYTEENWYVRKMEEFTTFDKFLADSFLYDTIDIVKIDPIKHKGKLEIVRFLEGEVI